jgi:hypothetical protein
MHQDQRPKIAPVSEAGQAKHESNHANFELAGQGFGKCGQPKDDYQANESNTQTMELIAKPAFRQVTLAASPQVYYYKKEAQAGKQA